LHCRAVYLVADRELHSFALLKAKPFFVGITFTNSFLDETKAALVNHLVKQLNI
jgi:hypothetical protein